MIRCLSAFKLKRTDQYIFKIIMLCKPDIIDKFQCHAYILSLSHCFACSSVMPCLSIRNFNASLVDLTSLGSLISTSCVVTFAVSMFGKSSLVASGFLLGYLPL